MNKHAQRDDRLSTNFTGIIFVFSFQLSFSLAASFYQTVDWLILTQRAHTLILFRFVCSFVLSPRESHNVSLFRPIYENRPHLRHPHNHLEAVYSR